MKSHTTISFTVTLIDNEVKQLAKVCEKTKLTYKKIFMAGLEKLEEENK